MATTEDSRYGHGYDAKFASDLLLSIAQEPSLQSLMTKLVRVGVERPWNARLEVWLVEKGPAGTGGPGHLRLAASAENPLFETAAEADALRCVEERIELGAGVLGRIAATGQPVVLRDIDREPSEFSGIEWFAREQVVGFSGTAITFKGGILGVIASYTRINTPEEARVWRQIFADYLGGAVANARAFNEIQALKAQLEMHNEYLEEEVVRARALGELVGQSAPLQNIVRQIDLVAPTDASVLILGETGTGKELVAREIHHRSRRADKPLIRVNCASIPKELYESEFFGHARGAFTGAVKDRAGRFETAEGGTIFLDEIAEIPFNLQSKLLRVLQEKRYERVGEDRTRLADVRIVGATNRDLKKEVEAGRFREDLYYRLNVFPIQVPPLRERPDDIPLLARHFIELSVKELRCPMPRLTRASVMKLQSYAWPGNIRELRNLIERAVIISRGGALDFDLPVAHSDGTRRNTPTSVSSEVLTHTEMKRLEQENIAAALRKTNWKIKGAHGAAELLGLKPTTLLTRMKRMGLKRPD